MSVTVPTGPIGPLWCHHFRLDPPTSRLRHSPSNVRMVFAYFTIRRSNPRTRSDTRRERTADDRFERKAVACPELTLVTDPHQNRVHNRTASNRRTMKVASKINVLFVAGLGPIVREPAESRKLYGEILGIAFKEESGGYLHTEGILGAKTFALWPHSQAAHSCFNKSSWPEELPAPQAWLEFDVDSVENTRVYLESQGGSNSRQEQEGTVGPNCHAASLTGRIIGRHHFHSLNAKGTKAPRCVRGSCSAGLGPVGDVGDRLVSGR